MHGNGAQLSYKDKYPMTEKIKWNRNCKNGKSLLPQWPCYSMEKPLKWKSKSTAWSRRLWTNWHSCLQASLPYFSTSQDIICQNALCQKYLDVQVHPAAFCWMQAILLFWLFRPTILCAVEDRSHPLSTDDHTFWFSWETHVFHWPLAFPPSLTVLLHFFKCLHKINEMHEN